jgi:NurA-like 5'-3' nuclease
MDTARSVRSPRQKLKKSKQQVTTNSELVEHMLPAKEHILKNHLSFPLTYETLLDFLQKTHGNKNIAKIANDFTTDIPALERMLTEIYGHLEERSLKSRITRIKKRLLNQHFTTSSEDLSSIEDQVVV